MLTTGVMADIEPGTPVPDITLISQDGEKIQLHDMLESVTVLHLWKCNWLQCRAEIPHLKKVMPDYEGKPVKFISVNTRDPKGQVKAEIKRYKIDYPVHLGRGQKITEKFKVMKLPRLILIQSDGTIYKDVMFLKAKELKADIDKLLEEAATPEEGTSTEPEVESAPEKIKEK